MSTFRSGNGGNVTVNANPLDVAVWTLDEGIKDTENTHSGTDGCTNYELVVKDRSWTLSVPWDEDNTPFAAELNPGDKVTIAFKHGDGSVETELNDTLVTKYRTICDNQGDIVRCEIEGKGGFLT